MLPDRPEISAHETGLRTRRTALNPSCATACADATATPKLAKRCPSVTRAANLGRFPAAFTYMETRICGRNTQFLRPGVLLPTIPSECDGLASGIVRNGDQP